MYQSVRRWRLGHEYRCDDPVGTPPLLHRFSLSMVMERAAVGLHSPRRHL